MQNLRVKIKNGVFVIVTLIRQWKDLLKNIFSNGSTMATVQMVLHSEQTRNLHKQLKPYELREVNYCSI